MQERTVETPCGSTYADYFSLRAATLGSALAAKHRDEALSYAELNARANQLAHYFQQLEVGPEVLVAVGLERSLDMLVAWLAVWKAGGAFLPLDPDYPAERLSFLLQDSRAPILLTRAQTRSHFARLPQRVLCWEELDLEHLPKTDLPARATAENLAYVLYTSGSTGAPKGVEITNRALLNHNLVMSQLYQLCPEDRVLQFAALSFDVALEEIFPSWLSGSTVVLRTRDVISLSRDFLQFVAREQISVLNLPTAYWHELVSELTPDEWPASVRLVVIGGEKASTQAYQRWKEVTPASVKLINAYGPTEATITAVAYEADRGRDTLPIGQPITNSYAAILDENRKPVPPGATGELYLGGVGLARGYRFQPQLTAARFIPNPLPNVIPSDRLYRTGDLARFNTEGELEFAGRVDDQIKVRGYRIEPGEIESALREHSAIKEAVVLAQEDRPGHKRLVAYLVSRSKPSPSVTELRRFLRERLPAYMLPSIFVPLGAMPMTPAGKLDKRALPQPETARPLLGQNGQAPRTGAEAELADVWQEVLRLKKVGITDNFFELGGDSLLALQILARVRERFGAELALSAFFAEPTIGGLAAALERADAEEEREMDAPLAAQRPGKPPASFVQEQLFFLHELDPRSDAYHMAAAFRVEGQLHPEILERALDQVVARHEALRTHLDYEAGRLCQCVAPNLRVSVDLISLAHVARRNRPAELQQRLEREVRRPFKLNAAPLFRVSLLRFSESQHVLVLVLHHSIADGWSLGILFREWQAIYEALAAGAAVPALPELQLQYADFAHWQRSLSQATQLQAHLNFWTRTLAGAPHALRWPEEQSEATGPQDGAPAARRPLTLGSRSVARARQELQSRRATPFMGLLGALALALWKWTGQSDLVIGTVIAGRTRREFENLIGCFMNFLPLRLRLQPDDRTGELLNQVRQAVLEAQTHQDCPFEHIVKAAGAPRNNARNPLFNVALLWHNYPPGAFAPRGLRAETVPLPARRPLLDLRLEAEPVASEWAVTCEYDGALFAPGAMDRLLQSFEQAFSFLLDQPESCLSGFAPEAATVSERSSWFAWPGRRARKKALAASAAGFGADHR